MRHAMKGLAVTAAVALFATGCSPVEHAAKCVSQDGLLELEVPPTWTHEASGETYGIVMSYALSPNEKGIGEAGVQIEELDLTKKSFESSVESDILFELDPETPHVFQHLKDFSVCLAAESYTGEGKSALYQFNFWVKASDSRAYKLELTWYSPLHPGVSEGILSILESVRLRHPGSAAALRTRPTASRDAPAPADGDQLLDAVEDRVQNMDDAP